MALNTADVVILITILISTGIGIYRGFVREVLTVLTWAVAAVIAYMYGKTLGAYIVFLDSEPVKEALGILGVFILVVSIGYIIKLIVIKAGKLAGVSTIDRVVGALFGILRGCVLVVLVLLVSSDNITNQDWYKKSVLLPKFAKAADVTSKATPQSWKDDIKREVKDIIETEQNAAPVEKAVPVTTTTTTSTSTDVTVTVTPTPDVPENMSVPVSSAPADKTTPSTPTPTVKDKQ